MKPLTSSSDGEVLSCESNVIWGKGSRWSLESGKLAAWLAAHYVCPQGYAQPLVMWQVKQLSFWHCCQEAFLSSFWKRLDVYCSLVYLVLVTPRGAQSPNSIPWYGEDIPGLNNKPSAIFAASFKDLKRVTICFSVLNLLIWIPLLPSSLTKAIASENEDRTWSGSGLNDKQFVQTLLPAN